MLVKLATGAGLAFCIAGLGAVIDAVPGAAQAALCGNRNAIVDTLKTKYNESRQAIGVAGTDSVVELYISEAGTWTMLVTSPNGRTCIMAAGHSWDGKPTLAAGDAI
jgi:hypothetical protein